MKPKPNSISIFTLPLRGLHYNTKQLQSVQYSLNDILTKYKLYHRLAKYASPIYKKSKLRRKKAYEKQKTHFTSFSIHVSYNTNVHLDIGLRFSLVTLKDGKRTVVETKHSGKYFIDVWCNDNGEYCNPLFIPHIKKPTGLYFFCLFSEKLIRSTFEGVIIN